MATYSNNTTISISSAVSVNLSSTSYVVPASSYFVGQAAVNLSFTTSGSQEVTVGGSVAGSLIKTNATPGAGEVRQIPIYAGPGQTIALGASLGIFGGTVTLTGVTFVNTP